MSLHIFQGHLDAVSRCVMTEDFDGYADQVILPFTLMTGVATIWVTCRDQLEEGFEGFAATMQDLGVTRLDRRAHAILKLGPDVIVGSYVTRTLIGTTEIIPPFRSVLTLRRDAGRWKAASISNDTQNERWPVLFPKVSEPI